jgi:ThiJ/PfpI family-like
LHFFISSARDVARTPNCFSNLFLDTQSRYRIFPNRADVILSSHVGYWLEELAAPYNTFTAAGYEVEIASISGGEPPLDAASLGETYLTEDTAKFQADETAKAKLAATKSVEEYVATASQYSAVFLPGGHGTAIDFADSQGLQSVIAGMLIIFNRHTEMYKCGFL